MNAEILPVRVNLSDGQHLVLIIQTPYVLRHASGLKGHILGLFYVMQMMILDLTVRFHAQCAGLSVLLNITATLMHQPKYMH